MKKRFHDPNQLELFSYKEEVENLINKLWDIGATPHPKSMIEQLVNFKHLIPTSTRMFLRDIYRKTIVYKVPISDAQTNYLQSVWAKYCTN